MLDSIKTTFNWKFACKPLAPHHSGTPNRSGSVQNFFTKLPQVVTSSPKVSCQSWFFACRAILMTTSQFKSPCACLKAHHVFFGKQPKTVFNQVAALPFQGDSPFPPPPSELPQLLPGATTPRKQQGGQGLPNASWKPKNELGCTIIT